MEKTLIVAVALIVPFLIAFPFIIWRATYKKIKGYKYAIINGKTKVEILKCKLDVYKSLYYITTTDGEEWIVHKVDCVLTNKE